MDDIFVQYQGFSPSSYTQRYIDHLMESLHEASPSMSVMRTYITRGKGEFKGMIKITSAAGDFFAMAHGPRLTEVGHALAGQIKKQLEKWKSRRFDHESLRTLDEASHA